MSNEGVIAAIYDQPRNSLTDLPQHSEQDQRVEVRELPLIPNDDHRPAGTNNTPMEMFSTDSGLSSATSPTEIPYSKLDSSTRDLPLPPAVYDSLAKPVYVNTNAAAAERINNIDGNEPRSNGPDTASPSITV